MSGSLEKQTTPPRTGFSGGSLAIGIGLAVAVLALVAVIFYLLKAANVVETAALVVGDREVSRADYDKYVKAGKDMGVSEANAKKIIIEYEKNKNIAKKYKIDLPKTYVELSRNNMIIESGEQQLGGTVEQLLAADDTLTQARMYSAAMNNYLFQSSDEGWSIVMYDVPYFKDSPSDARQSAHDTLSSLRSQLEKGDISNEKAIELLNDHTMGTASETKMYFVRKEDGALVDKYDGQVRAGVLDPSFLPTFLSQQKVGYSEVSNHDDRNEFFVNILYKQKGDRELLEKATSDKDQMKVVDYVRK